MTDKSDRDVISFGKSSSHIQLVNVTISDFDQALRISDQIQGELKEYITDIVLDNVNCSSRNATKVLLHAICVCESLKSFRWSNSPNLREDVDQLDVLLCDTKSMRSLDLSGNSLPAAAVQILMRPYTLSPTELASTASLFSLTSLNLSRNNIGDAGVLVICRCLLQFSRRTSSQKIAFHLEELHVNDCGLSDKSAFCLAQLLNVKSNPTQKSTISYGKQFPVSFPMGLKVLNISDNPNITGDGIAALLGDTKIGSISPLVKLYASKCFPSVSIFYELAMRLSNGLCPKLEVLDLSFSESGADSVIQQSASNYNKIFSSPICESLGRSLKVLSDTLVMTTHPGPSKTGPKFGSPSKGNRSNLSIHRIVLGELHEAMFNACVSKLNFSESNNFSGRNKLSPSGQRRNHLYEDCLMGLESMNPAAKFFTIDYVTNIAAWVEEGCYENSKFIHTPPSVGNRFATARTIDAEKQHVQRIRDSSPTAVRAVTNVKQSDELISRGDQYRETVQSTLACAPSPQNNPLSEKQLITPVKAHPSPINNNHSSTIIANEDSTSVPQSPSSPSFKRALSMSDTLKSAIKDLTERVKASQISLEHSIKTKSTAPKTFDDTHASLANSKNSENNNQIKEDDTSKQIIENHIPSRKDISSSSTVTETKPPEVTVDSIKAIVEETLHKFLSSSNNNQLIHPISPDHRREISTTDIGAGSNIVLKTNISSAIDRKNSFSPIQSRTDAISNHILHNEKISHPTAAKSNKEQLLSERNQLLEYLQRSKEDSQDMRAQSMHLGGSHDKYLGQHDDALMIRTLEDRLKSVEQLLYYQYLDDRKKSSQRSLSPERSIDKQRQFIEDNSLESNPLARRLISTLSNHPTDTLHGDKSISSIIQHQRQNDKRLVYVGDVQQRLELIEHLLEFDQELQREQDALANRVTEISFPAESSSSKTMANAQKVDKRLQRKEWINQIHKNNSVFASQPTAPTYLNNQVEQSDQSFFQQPFLTSHDLKSGASTMHYNYDDFGDILGGNRQLIHQPIMNTSYMPPPPRTPVNTTSTPRRASALSSASRQYIVDRHNASRHTIGTREEEIESVHSLPRHRRTHNTFQNQHALVHESSAPPLPNVHNNQPYPMGRNALPLPPLPFTTPGFLYPPNIVDTTPLSMQDQWHQITPTIRRANSGLLPESLDEPRSNVGMSSHHYMQSTTSSAMKSNSHNFHPSDSVHYRWTPSGIASNNHFDNPSPPITMQHRKRR